MARIVVSGYGTLGDFVPLLALAEKLRGRGHAVLAAVNPWVEPRFRSAGVETVPLGPRLGPEEAAAHGILFDARSRWNAAKEDEAADLTDWPRHYRELAAACRRHGASLLVAGATLEPARWVAEDVGIPWVRVYLSEPPVGDGGAGGGRPVDLSPGGDAPQGVAAPLGLHMDALPLPPPARKPVPGRTGPAFPDDGAQPGWLEPTSGLRSFLRSPAGDGPADPRRWRDGPLVLLPGSTPIPEPEVFLRAHVEAAAALSRRLVVQRGWAGLCAEMVDGSPPPHVHFSDALPYGWLLGRAAAAILTGRPGALARAVRAGCPVLVEPRGRDAFNNGRRVLELGVGRVLDPRSATTASVRRMLAERVMTPSVRRRCTALRRRLAGAPDGASQACDALEAWLEAGGS